MVAELAGVVLAAGAGRRLRPLTLHRPKPLCPVGNVALVDLALDRVRSGLAGAAGDQPHTNGGDDGTDGTDGHRPQREPSIAVNVHHGREAMETHLDGAGVHVSIEEDRALGTAGALGHLRGWLDGRAALVVNADAWCPGSMAAFVAGWDGERVRLLVPDDDELRPTSAIAGALMPWAEMAALRAEPSGLYEASWRRAAAEGRLEAVRHDGAFVDCGTPADYLEANLTASGGESVVGERAVVAGELDRCVVWPDAVVWPGESLVRAIRMTDVNTVYVRR